FSAPTASEVASTPVTGGPTLRPRRDLGPGLSPGRALSTRTPPYSSGVEAPRPPSRPTRWGLVGAAVLLVVVTVGAGAAWKAGLFARSYQVPNLVGASLASAAAQTAPLHFSVAVTARTHSASVASGHVVSQTPRPGTTARSGSTISVVVSQGASLVSLPRNVVGRGCAGATNELKSLHLRASCPASAALYSSSVASGDVVAVIYHGTRNPLAVPAGATVVLALSKGPNPATTTSAPTTTTTTASRRAVPNVIGDDYAQTYAAFKRAGLYFTTSGHLAGTTKWTRVISETPAAGTLVPYRSTVSLVVR
ncbi:MAG: PASTA domain-containing protein, partial [Acidimicrobiales bacterium]